MTQYNASLAEIIDKYDNFVIDVWGVLYNQYDLLPGAIDLISSIENSGKKFCILSNVPRPISGLQKTLGDLGLHIKDNNMITSGEFFREKIKEFSTKPIYVMGESVNSDILSGIAVNRTDDVADAEYFLMLSFSNTMDEVRACEELFAKAISHKVVMICPNPDVVVYIEDKIRYTPGAFAALYKEMGGEVLYFGKPHKPIYEHLFAKHGFVREKTLMIGDSLETDIKGAVEFGFDSLLLLTGVHRNVENLELLFENEKLYPTFVLSGLD